MTKPKKILCLPQRGIGDLIHFLPLIRTLREGYKNSKIYIPVIDREQIKIQKSFGELIGKEIIFKKYPIDKNFERRRIELYRTKVTKEGYRIESKIRRNFEEEIYNFYLRHEDYDLAIIPRKFKLNEINCKTQYNLDDLEKEKKIHIIDRNLKFAEILNLEKKIFNFNFTKERPKDINGRPLNLENYFIFLLSSGRKIKNWTIEGFAELIRFTLSKKITPVIIGSPEDYEKSRYLEGIGAINYTKKDGFLLDLENFAKISRNSSAIIGPDTGLLHLADATKTKVIGLYGPTRPEKFGPYNNLERVISTNNKSEEMKDISVEEIMSELDKIINQ